MAKLGINTTPPLGTPLPDGGGNINSNFNELYTLLGDGNELYPGIVTSITAGSNISISTSYGNVSIAVTSSAFTETLDTVTDRGNVTSNGIRVGVATASAFVKSGGTSSQFLKADGSVDSNTYLTSASGINLTLDEVTTNGNTTANNISVGGVTALGNVSAGASILAVNAAYASSFRRTGGSSTEFLKGDGSVDTNTYATEAYVDINAGYWVQDSVGINTISSVGIGTSAFAGEALRVLGDTRIIGVLTVGSASVTIDGDTETISVGNTISIGSTAIHVGTGVTITEDSILVGSGITISSVTNQIFIQGKEVIDRWKVDSVGISTTSKVGIGTTAKAEYQLDVLGDSRFIGNITIDGITSGIVTQITAGNGISVDPLSGEGSVRITAVGATSLVGSLQQVTDNGDETTNTITASAFIKSGGTSSQFLKADGSVDSNTYATTSQLSGISTAGLASETYVDTAVGLATNGLASVAYVDTAVGLATAGISTEGLASVAYVDTAVGLATAGISTTGLASEGYVDTAVGLSTAGISTAGLASEGYVDTAVGLSTAGISTAGLASEGYVDTAVGLSTAGISTEGLASITYVDNLVAISTSGLGGGGSALTVKNLQGRGGAEANPEVTNVNTIVFDKNSGFNVSDEGSGEVFVDLGSTFNPWYVDGQSTLKADGEEPIEFIAGAGIAITTKAVASVGIGTTFSKAITITSTGGGVSQSYVDTAVGLATAGLASEQYVGLATAGLASIAYVDNLVSISTAGLGGGGGVSQSYVDNAVGLATVGLASTTYVDNLVAISTAGLGAGVTDVNSLTDVTINSSGSNPLTDGDILEWDNFNSIWTNRPNIVNSTTGAYFGVGDPGTGNPSIVQIEGLGAGGALELSNGGSPVAITIDNDPGIAGQVLSATGNDGFGNATGVGWTTISAGAGNTANVLTESLAIVNPIDAVFTVGQDIDGSAIDHLGIYYGSGGGTAAVGADVFTSNGDLSFWVDANGVDTGSQFEFGTNFNQTWASISSDGSVFTGVVTAFGGFSGDGSGLSNVSSVTSWELGANGTNDYTFTGPGFTGAVNDPTLTLIRGQRYTFTNTTGAHPFQIQSTQGQGGTAYNDGIINNGTTNGTLLWDVQFDAPDTLYYQCTAHSNMQGTINILNAVDTSNFATTTQVGLATAGLASEQYVGLATAGLGLPTRQTLSGTTNVVNAGASTLLTISGYKTYALQSIQVTQASWVRLYTDPTARSNDSSRLYTEDPQPGSGLIAEVRTETSGTSTFIMSPGVIGWNNNNNSNIYATVTNNESSNLTITVNLQAVQLEA